MSSDCQDDDTLCLWCKHPRHEGMCSSNPLYRIGASSDALLDRMAAAAKDCRDSIPYADECLDGEAEAQIARLDAALAEYDRLRAQSSVATDADTPERCDYCGMLAHDGTEYLAHYCQCHKGGGDDASPEVAAAPVAADDDEINTALRAFHEAEPNPYAGTRAELEIRLRAVLNACREECVECAIYCLSIAELKARLAQPQASGVAAVDDARVEGTPAGLEAIARWIEAGCFNADRMSVRRIMAANVRQFKNITTAQPQPATGEPPKVTEAKADAWRCFHCDEVFTNHDEALAHFGTNLGSESACKIDAAEYRRMEETVRRCNAEDTDKDREIYAMRSQHALDLRREEEKGYARGMEDMRKELAAPPAPERAEGQRVTNAYAIAASAVCEARNQWSKEHEAAWLEGAGQHPDDFIGRAVVDALGAVVREGETK